MTIAGLGGVASVKEQESSLDVRQLVIFKLIDGIYGLDIQYVREINRLTKITPIPKAPAFVEGIINLRGTIVPVVNLSKRFGLGKTEHTKDTRIVVIENGEYTLGMEVDGVSEVLRIPANEIDPATNMSTTGIAVDFVEGVGKVDDQLILILDTKKLFSAEEHAQLAEIVES
ncbi:MAG: chemotaxis protein CheW [Candidatus Neomarinimicrobiota bacterium]